MCHRVLTVLNIAFLFLLVVKNVVGVIARYMAALQEFRRSVSMKVAFDRIGVDRNTISRTAAIAELSLAAPEVFHALAPWDEKEETLAHYAHRCRQAMDDTIKAKIKTMKAKGELLPIVSKWQFHVWCSLCLTEAQAYKTSAYFMYRKKKN